MVVATHFSAFPHVVECRHWFLQTPALRGLEIKRTLLRKLQFDAGDVQRAKLITDFCTSRWHSAHLNQLCGSILWNNYALLVCLTAMTLRLGLWKMFLGQAQEKDHRPTAGAAPCTAACAVRALKSVDGKTRRDICTGLWWTSLMYTQASGLLTPSLRTFIDRSKLWPSAGGSATQKHIISFCKAITFRCWTHNDSLACAKLSHGGCWHKVSC